MEGANSLIIMHPVPHSWLRCQIRNLSLALFPDLQVVLIPFLFFLNPQSIIALIFMVVFECRLKIRKSVTWTDVTVIEEGSHDDVEVVFTETQSPSESLMSRSVHVDIPPTARTKRRPSRTSLGERPCPVVVQQHERRRIHSYREPIVSRRRGSLKMTPEVTESFIRSVSID